MNWLRARFATDFTRTALILTTVTIAAAVIDYAFQVLMGRLLGVTAYGTLGTLLGVLYLLRIPYNGIEYVTTRNVAILTDPAERRQFLHWWGRKVSVVAMFVAAVVWVSRPLISTHIEAGIGIYTPMLAAIVLSMFIAAAMLGLTRGLERFFTLSLNYLALAGIRLVAGVAFVLAGFEISGALGGMLVAYLVVIVWLAVILRDELLPLPGTVFSDNGNQLLHKFTPALLVAFCFNVPTNADLLLVGYLESATVTGQYTAITVFGKGLLFLPYGIVRVLFPQVAGQGTESETQRQRVRQALVLTIALVGPAVIVLVFAPSTLLSFVYGSDFAGLAYLLPLYGLTMGIFSVAFVILNVFLARGVTIYPILFAAGTVCYVVVSFWWSSTPAMIVGTMCLTYSLILIIGVTLLVSGWTGVERWGL